MILNDSKKKILFFSNLLNDFHLINIGLFQILRFPKLYLGKRRNGKGFNYINSRNINNKNFYIKNYT